MTHNPLAVDSVDILYRGRFDADSVDVRADDDAPTGSTLFGHFSRFEVWYEINSWLEGRFMERTRLGSFTKTIAENRSSVVCSFDHGYDTQIGDKPLGPITELREDDDGPYYEVPLLDTDYNHNFILPALQGRTIDGRNLGSVLGASFRFRVVKDEWDNNPPKSAHNPDRIPERTITEMRLFEFGPVVYPASPDATASVRGLTDHFFERSLRRQQRTAPNLGAGATTPNPAEPLRHSANRDASRVRLLTATERNRR